MRQTTSINLGEHFTGLLSKLTSSGRYGSASEAVRAGLRLLEEDEAKREALLSALDEGEASGESDVPLSDLIAEAKAEFNGR